MVRCFSAIWTITLLSCLMPGARADVILSLTAEATDLQHLAVGQSVRFDVQLSGLGPGGQLDYLAGTVDFPAALLGTPTNVAAGPIVPDLTGFMGTGFPGIADAFYDAVFFSATNTPISANGTFFTFDVVAQQPGSGSLLFDPTSLAATDGTNSPVPLGAGPPLNFTILAPSATAVPEPSTLALVLTGAAGWVGIAVCRGAVRRLRKRVVSTTDRAI